MPAHSRCASLAPMGRRVAIAAGAGLLLAGTVLVFRAFDRHSHSASDTLRPFVLTMAPLWIAGVVAARAVLLRRGRVARTHTDEFE